MLCKKDIKEIKERFTKGGADKPLCIEGDHLNDQGEAISLGWGVRSADGHGLKLRDKEYHIQYASNTTFEAATFLAHLPVDMANLLSTIEQLYILLEDVLAGNEKAREFAKLIIDDYHNLMNNSPSEKLE